MSKARLAIVSTHPIQYYAPVFRSLAASGAVDPRVFYTWSQRLDGPAWDHGFREEVSWDIPLLGGYAHEAVPNVSRRPGSHRFFGIVNPTLLQVIDRWNPDALLVYGWNSWSHLRVLRHFKGRVPVLFRGDSTLLDEQPRLRAALRRTLLRWVYRHVDVAVAVGQNNRDYFEWCGLPPGRIGFAPHCIDNQRFGDDSKYDIQAASWRNTLGIDAAQIVILFAGKLQPKKDPGILLEAFQHLAHDQAHLIFIGQGELEPALKDRAAGDPRIHFMGFQNQSLMPAAYRLGDLLVLPSRGPGETWGLALNEAMACGRAIVASSKVGAARDLVRDGIAGWLFEAGNVRALTTVLDHAVKLGRDRLRVAGQLAREIIADWTIDRCAARIEAAVTDAVKRSREA